jgi:hypothetical protein
MRNYPYENFYFKSRKNLLGFLREIRSYFMYDVDDNSIVNVANGDVKTEIDIAMLKKNNYVYIIYAIAKQYQGMSLDEYVSNILRK